MIIWRKKKLHEIIHWKLICNFGIPTQRLWEWFIFYIISCMTVEVKERNGIFFLFSPLGPWIKLLLLVFSLKDRFLIVVFIYLWPILFWICPDLEIIEFQINNYFLFLFFSYCRYRQLLSIITEKGKHR